MIQTVHQEGIAILSLNRPEARNALATRHWLELAAAVAWVSEASPSVVLLRSTDSRCFCAGADMDEFALLAANPADRAPFLDAMRSAIDGLAALPMPVVAEVQGGSHGAGIALMLACDIIIAAPVSRFSVPAARLGLGYPGEDVARLTARIRRGGAARLLLAAETLSAEDALRLGLIDRIEADATAAAMTLCHRIAANDTAAVALLKRRIADPMAEDNRAEFLARFGSDAFVERLAGLRGAMTS